MFVFDNCDVEKWNFSSVASLPNVRWGVYTYTSLSHVQSDPHLQEAVLLGPKLEFDEIG